MTGGFPLIPLAEVLRPVGRPEAVHPDKTYRLLGAHWYAKGLYVKGVVPGSEIRANTLYRVERGDFVYNRLFAWKGSFAIATAENHDCYVSNEFPCFAVNQDRLDGNYLWRYFSRASAWEEALALSTGGTPTSRNRLKEEKFLAIKIALPPLEEQRLIVARIEELANKIEDACYLRHQAAAGAEALWSSALAAAFQPESTDGVPKGESAADLLQKQAEACARVPRDKYNNAHAWAPSIYSDGPYELPPTWVWTDLGSVLTHLVDCVNDTPDFVDRPTAFIGLKSTNVRPYKLDLSQAWFVTRDDFDLWNRRERPQAGDLILTREAPMGNVCVLSSGVQACLTQRLMLLRADETFVATRYVLHFLNSSLFQNQIVELCRGLTTPHVRVQDAPLLRVPLAPLSEQRRIASYLDETQAQVDALKQSQADTATELNALLPSILDKAFKGEL